MTKDFRNVGRIPTPDPADSSPAADRGLAQNQRVILHVIQFSAIGFFLAGIWLLTGRPSPIPHEISIYIGIAFVIAALSDLVVVQVLKRVWLTKSGG